MTPKEYGVRAATTWNANNPEHFPGRPLFEGLVANAVTEAVEAALAESRGSGTIQTNSGQKVSVMGGLPEPDDIFLAYCRTPMFAGQTDAFYSVGHHCLAAAELAENADCSTQVVFFILMHELEVVAFGDTPGPLKNAIQRRSEKTLRNRYFEDVLGCSPTDKEWASVEYYDKLEQAAAAMLSGMTHPVHAPFWESCSFEEQMRACRSVRQIYEEFPPMLQLRRYSPLQEQLTSYYWMILEDLGLCVPQKPTEDDE